MSMLIYQMVIYDSYYIGKQNNEKTWTQTWWLDVDAPGWASEEFVGKDDLDDSATLEERQ